MRIGRSIIKYVAAIIVLALLAVFMVWTQSTVSPQLGIFFGFVLGYAIAVFVLFYILGRYGG